jgi:hypothetical protein
MVTVVAAVIVMETLTIIAVMVSWISVQNVTRIWVVVLIIAATGVEISLRTSDLDTAIV